MQSAPVIESASGGARVDGARCDAHETGSLDGKIKRRMKRAMREILKRALRNGKQPGGSEKRQVWILGWLVSGLAPLALLALALTEGERLVDTLASLNLGAPSGTGRVTDAYGLIILALTVVVSVVWGFRPGLATLGEGTLGLVIIIYARQVTLGSLGGWVMVDVGLVAVALMALEVMAARLECNMRAVSRLKQGMAWERAQMEAALDASSDALAFYDQTGRVERLNQEARRLFAALGLDVAGGEGTSGALWMCAEHPLAREDLPDARALRGDVIREELLVAAPRGKGDDPERRLALAVSAAPILGPDGAIAGAVMSLRDVSEEAKRPPGEWSPVQRGRMDAFIGMASHELRTPLTTIKASVQLALRKLNRTDDPEAIEDDLRQLLTRADQQVGRMTRLIEDLLDTSRIASGRLTLRFEQCDLQTLTREAVRAAQLHAPERTIWLQMDGEPALVWGDPDRLAQVVGTYLSNALKFSDVSQPVEARVWGRWRADETGDAEGWRARVEVRDHGPGIKVEALERVWDRFYQDPELVAHVGSEVGLGLGLYLCRAIVEAHHGAVGVENASGGGALFWFTMPALAG